jgi:hypothetical protein
MIYNYIKYIGPTIYQTDKYTVNWYDTETILTQNKIYRLIKPFKFSPNINRKLEYILYVEDDILLAKPSDEKSDFHMKALKYDQYNGSKILHPHEFEFVSNREYNLEVLVK